MPTLVFDLRANHDTGVSRFGLTTLAAAAPMLSDAGWTQIVVAQPGQARRAEAAVRNTNAAILCCPDGEGFVRQSPWLRDLLVERRADLYFTAHYTVDRHCPVPYVFTIHDLTRLRFPELSYTDATFANRYGRAELALIREELEALSDWDSPADDRGVFARYFRALTHDLAARAEQVVTVSKTTAHDIETVLNVDPRRLALVPCTVNTHVFCRQDDGAVHAVRQKFGVTGPYLLFIGLAHPNKRIAWLLRHLIDARDRFPAGAKLVAVGGYAERVPEVTGMLARHDAADFVIFTGRVCDPDLAALYGGAAALVTASISEGSNLPSQEAMACGCQVIATDISAHRETLQDAAVLYPPECSEQLVFLATEALRGNLPDRARAYRPPGREIIGRRLFEALTQAVDR